MKAPLGLVFLVAFGCSDLIDDGSPCDKLVAVPIQTGAYRIRSGPYRTEGNKSIPYSPLRDELTVDRDAGVVTRIRQVGADAGLETHRWRIVSGQ